MQVLVGHGGALLPGQLHGAGGTDAVDGLGNGDALLGDVDGVHEVVTAFYNAVGPQADLVQVAPGTAQVPAVLEEGAVAGEAVVDADHADAGVLFKGFQGHLPGDLPLAADHHGDDVAVGDGGVDQDAGGGDVGHDGHEVHRLVGGGFFHLQGVGEAPVIVAGVRHPADDGDGGLLHAVGPVQAVHGANEAGGVAGGQLQVLLVNTLFVVCIAMEENVGHGVFLAALEDCFDAGFFIERLVLGTYAAGGGVQHDVHLAKKVLERAGHGNAQFIQSITVGTVHQVEVIRHAFFI